MEVKKYHFLLYFKNIYYTFKVLILKAKIWYNIKKKKWFDMFNLEYFSNDNYKVLKFLYDNQIQVKDEYYIVLSQQEIADMVQFSKLKTNGII